MEPWVQEIEIVNEESSATTSAGGGSTENLFPNVKEVQIAELGIFRDLGPFGRMDE